MIAKSKWGILLSALLISVAGCAVPKEIGIKNLHEQIIDEYDIHPPVLQYGYPLWYQYDSLPITGIIFLKKDLDDLYRMDKITYVAEPTKENAEIIFNFSGEIEEYPKFYIVPDSNLTWSEVSEFMEFLTPDYGECLFMLCGAKGLYTQIKFKDISTRYPGVIFCGDRNALSIRYNSKGEILFDGNYYCRDSIYAGVYNFYCANHGGVINDYSCLDWQVVTVSTCEESILRIKEYIAYFHKSGLDDWQMTRELNDAIKLQRLVAKWGAFSIPVKYAEIKTWFNGHDQNVSLYYRFLDQINLGVYRCRKGASDEYSPLNYEQLFTFRKTELLSMIHVQYPDITTNPFYKNEEIALSSPPIEEVIIVYDPEKLRISADTLIIKDTLITD